MGLFRAASLTMEEKEPFSVLLASRADLKDDLDQMLGIDRSDGWKKKVLANAVSERAKS